MSGRTTTAWSGCSSFFRLQGQLTSWLRELSQYHMVMQHRHCNTDALSQMPVFPWRLRNRGGGRCRDFCQTRIIALPPPRLGTEICQLSMSDVVLGNVLGGGSCWTVIVPPYQGNWILRMLDIRKDRFVPKFG